MNSIQRRTFGTGGGLRIKQGARYLGMAPSTYYDHVNKNSPRHDPDLPKAVSIGPMMRILLIEEMDAYLNARALERDKERDTDFGASPASQTKSIQQITEAGEQDAERARDRNEVPTIKGGKQ